MNDFNSRIRSAALESELIATSNKEGDLLNMEVSPWPHAPWWLRIIEASEAEVVGVEGIVRAEGLSGDRSDIHDILAGLWAILLQTTGRISIYIEDIPHPVVPGELRS